MGYRTTLIINNDQLERLTTDSYIGAKIKKAILQYTTDKTKGLVSVDTSSHSHTNLGAGDLGPLGQVVEQDHADMTKLVIIGKNGSFDIEELACSWYSPKDQNIELDLLRVAADKLGYRLIKKPIPKDIDDVDLTMYI